MRRYLFPIVFLWPLTVFAVNQAYYSSLNGKSGETLRAALTELLYTKHTKFVSYNWDFPYDYDSEGNMLDIYSSCGYNDHNTYPTSYKCCCDAVNREHVVCQSNFGGSSNNGKVPQYSDRHHLYPVDGRANGHRSDLPFGECSGGKHGSCSSSSTIIPSEGTSTCENHEYGRSGASTFSVALPSGGGSVYEVGDEYKGDIARAILYMVVRYADKPHCRLPDGAKNATTNLTTPNDYPVTAWANTTRDKVGQMFSSDLSTNHGLSDYGKALLLKWHRQDPVSAKEIARNNGVESAQGNRNPFVDYPCLVEYLWGDHAGDAVTLSDLVGSWEDGFSGDGCSNSGSPVIIRPTEAIDLGTTSTSTAITRSIIIQGASLTGGLSLAVGGANASYFTLSQKSISQSVATNGKAITITYQPAASGSHSATLQISGGGLAATHEVALTGSCCNQYNVTLYRNGQPEVISCCGTYNLPAANTEADACDGWTFRGWSTNSSVNTMTAPAFVTAVSSASTLYAVYGHLDSEQEEDTTLSMDDYAAVSGTFGSFTFAAVKNNGSTEPAYNSTGKDARIYAKGTLTISCSQTMTDIVFNLSTQGKKRLAPITAGIGTIATQTSGDATVAWSGSANSVSFTVGDKADYGSDGSSNAGQLCFSSVAITRRMPAITYKTIPCPTYRVTYADVDGIAEGGQYYASSTASIAGTVISLEAEPNDGYTFDGWMVTKADDESTIVSITGNQFTMPEYDVLVTAGFSAIPTYTATWMANGSHYASQAGLYANDIPNVPDRPGNCSASRVFVGWTTQADFPKSDSAPEDLFTATAPAITKDTVFYAVYADEQTSSGTPGAVAGTTVWAETWTGATTASSANDNATPSANYGHGTTVYNSGAVTYTQSDNTTYVRNERLASGDDSHKPELMLAQDKTWTISNISTAGATDLTLTYASNNSNSRVTCSTDGASISGSPTSYTVTTGGAATITLVFSAKSGNSRIDDISLTVKTAGATGGGETTHSNYSLHCSEATYTLTFMARGLQHAVRSGHTDEVVERVEAPAACEGYMFAGWSTQQYAANNTTLPDCDYSGRVPNSSVTYYAVYTNAGNADMTNNYRRITQRTMLTTGNYVVAGNAGELYYALSTTTKDSYYLAGTSVSPEDEVISDPDGSIVWHITVNGEIATFYNSAAEGYLYALQNGKYYNIYVGDNTNNTFTYAVSDGNWIFTSVAYSTQVLEYYITKTRWAFYTTPDAPVYLYKQQPDPLATIVYTTIPECSGATGIEDVKDHANAAKRIVNGQLLIERNGKTYNALGVEVK